MMKVALFLSLLGCFPTISLACRCIKQPTATSALEETSHVFRGLVVRELRSIDSVKRYVVRAGRVYKGCLFDMSERIIVSTGTNSCGSTLAIGETYVLSGASIPIDAATLKLLGKNTKISQDVNINLCSFHQEWDTGLLAEDKKILRKFVNKCTSCKTGKDCLDNFTCDKGECIDYTATCPVDKPPAPCAANPCDMAQDCADGSCFPYYCGGCTAIFVDAEGTRVCN